MPKQQRIKYISVYKHRPKQPIFFTRLYPFSIEEIFDQEALWSVGDLGIYEKGNEFLI